VAFLSNLIKRKINPDATSLANDISRSFGENSVSKTTCSINWLRTLKELVQDQISSEPLTPKITRLFQDAKADFATIQEHQKYLKTCPKCIRDFMPEKFQGRINVLTILTSFITEHKKQIAALQAWQKSNPNDYKKDLAELSKTMTTDVITALRFLAESAPENPEIDEEDFVIVDQASEASISSKAAEPKTNKPEPIKSTATLSQPDPKQLTSRPEINNETTDLDLYPL